MASEAMITIREVLLLLLAADKYPRLSNHDWRVAEIMEAEALAKAATAVNFPNDPPEFAVWLATLRQTGLTGDGREAVYVALYDYFDPEMTT